MATAGSVLLVALWPGGRVSASTDAGAGPSAYSVTGWSGQHPVSVGVAVSSSGARAGTGTVAFTTADGAHGSTLWVADRPAYGLWGRPIVLGSRVVAGTASFAEAGSGAAVTAWDELGPGGSVALKVSYRSVAGSSWTAPSTLVNDEGRAHLASVGITSTGILTVAFAHDAGGGVALFTRQHGSAGWGSAVKHSARAPRQVRLSVDGSGDATLAWTQRDPTHISGQALSLRVSRFDAASHDWGAPVLLNEQVTATGLLDVDSNAQGRGGVAYVSQSVTPVLRVAHYMALACGAACPAGWVDQGLAEAGTRPSASIRLNEISADDGVVVAYNNRLPDGTSLVTVIRSNGTTYQQPPTVVIPTTAKVSDVRFATGGALVVAWTQTNASGSALVVLPLRFTYLGVVAAGLPTILGAVTPGEAATTSHSSGLGVAWTDPSGSSSALRSWLPAVSGMLTFTHPFTTSTRIHARWQPAKASGAGATYDLQAIRATPTTDFGKPRTLLSRTKATSAMVTAKPGQTVCLASRAHNPDGYTTPWSAPRCSTVALDDTALVPGRGWTRQKRATFYGGSRLTSTTKGARLSLRGTRGVGVALLVTRRPGGGRIDVRSRSRIETVSTAGARKDQVIIGERLYNGNVIHPYLHLTVHGQGHPVSIDGVFIARALTP